MSQEDDLANLLKIVEDLAADGNQGPRRAVVYLIDEAKWARGQANIQREANIKLKEQLKCN